MKIILDLTLAEEEILRQGAERAGMDVSSFVIGYALKTVQREETMQADTVAFLTEETRRSVTEAQSKLHEKGIGSAAKLGESVMLHNESKDTSEESLDES